jgi:transposase-like protein
MRKRAEWERAIAEGDFWTAAEAWEALGAWKRSGESIVAFARRHGMSAKRLYWWRHRLKKEGTPGECGPARLIPIAVRPAETQPSEGVVVVAGELRVEVRDASATSPAWVATLLRLARESGA